MQDGAKFCPQCGTKSENAGGATAWIPGAGATVAAAGEISEDELKEKMQNIMNEQNVKAMMKEAQSEYVKARKAGTVSGNETVDLEEEES